jgi:hypothetical protein
MTAGGGRPSTVPAGYTYLGQFVDHDLTFDRTSVMLGVDVSPALLLQARSPSLDLDSLYGAGPADAGSARFYEPDGMHLRTGTTVAADGIAAKAGFDLPRGAGTTVAAKRKAVIPEPRNDENLAVAQTHLAFIRFHNRVVDRLPASVPPAQRFAQARDVVTRHYQWMLRTDYLPRICAPSIVDDVFAKGRKAFEVGVDAMSVPTMPIEFSVAAFRLGHSMIRSAYNWNRVFDGGAGTLGLLFASRQAAATSAARRGCPARGSRTSAGCMTSARRGAPIWPCPRRRSIARCGSTRPSRIRCRRSPASPRTAPTSPSATCHAPRWSSSAPGSSCSPSCAARDSGRPGSPTRRSATAGTARGRRPSHPRSGRRS